MNPKVSKLLDGLEPDSTELSKRFLSNTFASLLSAQEDNPDPNDLRLIQDSLSELVQSVNLFKKYRHVRKVCIFGSARTPEDHPNFILAEETAKKISESNMLVITGAGPGIMEAGNKGAGIKHSFGLHIILPFEQAPNKYIDGSSNLIEYRYFFVRKLTFVKESDAIVLFPGGFGTQDEGFEVLTLIQTGKCAPRPFIVLNYEKSHYWESWLLYVKTQLMEREYISENDMKIIKVVSNPDEVVDAISHFYSNYHSLKYYNDVTCIRLNRSISKKDLTLLNKKFNYIISSGSFELKTHDYYKEEENRYIDKPRLFFDFNHKNYGCLYNLIDHINNLN